MNKETFSIQKKSTFVSFKKNFDTFWVFFYISMILHRNDESLKVVFEIKKFINE